MEKFVLERFSKEEKKIVDETAEKACLILETIIEQGTDKAREAL